MNKFKTKDRIFTSDQKMRKEVWILVFDFCLPKYLKKSKRKHCKEFGRRWILHFSAKINAINPNYQLMHYNN